MRLLPDLERLPYVRAFARPIRELAARVMGRTIRPQATSRQEPPAAIPAATVDDVQRLDYPKFEIKLRVTSSMERVHRLMSCTKEPWTVEWLESLAPAEVLYDIGANVGAYSLIAAKRGSFVVAFEPGATTYGRLCENIVLNGCEASIMPVPLALSDVTGLVGFKYRTLEPGQSRHSIKDGPWQPWQPARPGRYVQPVCAMRLDDALEQFGLPAPHHLKIDVDGAERRLLTGAARTLASRNVRSALIEIAPELWRDVVAACAQAGLRLSDRHQRTEKGPSYALFTRA